MKPLRKLLDKLHPKFSQGGKYEKYYPLYEAADTFLYTPGEVTKGPSHVRDGMDLKRMMITVVVALIPCVFMAMWNTGFQANNTIHNRRIAQMLLNDGTFTEPEIAAAMQQAIGRSLDEVLVETVTKFRVDQQMASDASQLKLKGIQNAGDRENARREMVAAFDEELRPVVTEQAQPTFDHITDAHNIPLADIGYEEDAHAGWMQTLGGSFNPESFWSNLVFGAVYFLPVYIVCMAVGGAWEVLFAVVRGHEVNEGFLVTGLLFPLTLPPTIPLWQVGLGITFGVVIGKEVFGGTGRNFLNPALTARAFLYFAYPAQITGEQIWTGVSVDGFSGATSLGVMATAPISEGISAMNVSWWQAFIGTIQGSMGETSTLACLLGAVILIYSGIGSWRIMAGVVAGMVGTSLLFCLIGSDSYAMFYLPPWWHFVLGGFAFGTVFMATDPVSASMTEPGKWVYGGLIGVLTVIIRSANPAFPEGIMLAILLGNVFAPLIDYYFLQANIKRRLARSAA